MLEFRALGPIEVVFDGTPIELPKGMDRVLLAVFVLSAPQPVSVDELVEALWRDSAPATAPEMIRNSVARLRARIGPDALETTPAGYRLVGTDSAIDLRRFERLAASGAQALEAGDAARASDELGKALALWRGRPLPELDDSPAYAPRLHGLEELRLRVEEDRTDAELALGHAASLVASLEALHEEHPYRERLLGQLMLALYGAGRQKDALDRYTAGRRRLVDEVGLEPTPELQELQQRILRQDPGLAPTARPVPATEHPAPSAPRSRRSWRLLLPAFALVAAAAGILVAAWPGAAPVRIPRRGLVALRTTNGRPAGATAFHTPPGLVAADADRVWVATSSGPSVLEFSSQRLAHPRVVRIPQTAFSLAVAGGSVWVGNGFAGTISRIDGLGRVARTFRPEPHAEGRLPLAAAGGRLWVASQDGALTRLDPASGRRVRTYRGIGLAQAIAADGKTVWIADARSDVVEHFDTAAGRIVGRPVQLGGRGGAIVVGDGSVWVLMPLENTLLQIDPRRYAVAQTFSVPSGSSSLATTAGRVWVGSASGLLTEVDTAKDTLVSTESLGRPIDGLAAAGDVLWACVG